MTGGSLVVAGLGPGKADWVTPEVSAALDVATDIVGYAPYVARVPERPGLVRHASDNRGEVDRAREAILLALAGRHVVVVSGGDPGIFAMAAAVLEALESRMASRPGATSRCGFFPGSRPCRRPPRGWGRRSATTSASSRSPTT